MNKKEYDVKRVSKWECPAETGVPLITMPNVPRPLHGLPPRKIMGNATWNHVRKRCYFDAGYKCEICGADPPKGQLHAHELYTYDWKEGTGSFDRCIAICKQDHDFIHSGRLITMYKNGNPLCPKSYVLSVVEKGFKLISEYNKTAKKKLRAYATFLEYLKTDIGPEVEALIDKYNIEFYAEPKHIAKWGKWRLIWCGKEYPTPYASQLEWEEAMAEADKNDTARTIEDPFQGGIFDEIKEKLEND